MTRRLSATILGLAVMTLAAACGGPGPLKELQTIKSGSIDVVILSARDVLKHGKDDFAIEFRSAGGVLVDVGNVRATASMSMSGTPMFGSVSVQRTDVPGRYRAEADFSMAGTWRLTVEWDGPAGKGSVAFSGSVQ